MIHEGGSRILILLRGAENRKKLRHTLRLVAGKIFFSIVLVADPLNLDLTQFDLTKLVLLMFSLVDDHLEVSLADLAITEFFVDTVLVSDVLDLLVLGVEQFLLIISLFE